MLNSLDQSQQTSLNPVQKTGTDACLYCAKARNLSWRVLRSSLIKKLTDINRCLTDPANQCLTDV